MRTLDTQRGRTLKAITCAMTATVALVASGCSGDASNQADGDPAVMTTSAGPSPSEATAALDTTGWTTYTSETYDLRLAYPPGWTETSAIRRWRSDLDVADALSPAHERFRSSAGDVGVSVWTAPLDPATREETTDYLVAWVEDYCEASENTPCSGIADRAVELCLEKRDCHPGLLVPFESDVQAFFSGGDYAADAMTIVAVWRPESDASVAPYGGARRLLEGFLSTMDVRPS